MEVLEFLQPLIGQMLCYGLKSPDTDLYDFGFGNADSDTNLHRGKKESCTHFLHAVCRFKVIWRSGERRVDKYYEDTASEKFNSEVKRLEGMKVRRVGLISDKNDLWLDFGDYWVVFATFENGEESWRVFTSNTNDPHLVASDAWIRFD